MQKQLYYKKDPPRILTGAHLICKEKYKTCQTDSKFKQNLMIKLFSVYCLNWYDGILNIEASSYLVYMHYIQIKIEYCQKCIQNARNVQK